MDKRFFKQITCQKVISYKISASRRQLKLKIEVLFKLWLDRSPKEVTLYIRQVFSKYYIAQNQI